MSASNLFKRSILASAVLALSAGSAFASDTKVDSKAELDRGVPGIDVDVDVRARMSKFDTNSDSKITKAEAKGDARLTKEFKTLDKNKDGALDRGEFSKFEVDVDIGAPGDQPNRPYTQDDIEDEQKKTGR